MTKNPYQSPQQPGAGPSARPKPRWLRTLVGVSLLLGGFAMLMLSELLLPLTWAQPDSIVLRVGCVLSSLVGLGMLAAAGLMSVGLIWRRPAPRRYDGPGRPGT